MVEECLASDLTTKAKLLRYDANGWVLYYCRLSEGTFRWRPSPGSGPVLGFDRRRLQWLLDGLDPRRYLEWLLDGMPNAGGLTDATLARFLPWSADVPDSCRLRGAAFARSKDMPDEPLVDIDPESLETNRD